MTPRHAVDRPRLRRQLDLGLRAPLTVTVAPAGSGKTVLLTQWAASRPDLDVAWIDATPADDDAAHFARRLVDAHPALNELTPPPGDAAGGLGAPLLDAIAEALPSRHAETVLVFDDLHTVHNPHVLNDLWALADRLPPTAHLIFSSRSDAGLRWSRARLEHSIVEIRQPQLAFDDAETAQLLQQIVDGGVSKETAQLVHEHTGGWAAGIQLVGLTLRARPRDAALAAGLTESDRLVVDYFSEEVLDAQPVARRDALLRLVVPDELHTDMVGVLTDDAYGTDLPDQLEHESMFIDAVVDRPGWYRFHPLFRDVVRRRLRQEQPAVERELLRRLASWHAQHDDPASAIETLLRARIWREAMDLILERGRDPWEQDGVATIARWLRTVPEPVRRTRVDAELLYGVALELSGRASDAADVLAALAADPAVGTGRRAVALTYIAAAVLARPHPEMHINPAMRALDLLAEVGDVELPRLLNLTRRELLGALALCSAGEAHLLLGHLDEARGYLGRALATLDDRDTGYRVHLLGSLAIVEAVAGRLRLASALARDALETAREAGMLAHPASTQAQIARAFVAVQMDDPDRAALSLQEGMLRATEHGRTELSWLAYLASRPVARVNGDPDPTTPPGAPPPLVRVALEAFELRTARHAGAPRRPRTPASEWSAIAFEEIAAFLAEDDLASARQRIDELAAPPETHSLVAVVERETLLGWLCAREGRTAQAQRHLLRAVELAEPEQLSHVFVRAGRELAELIELLPGAPTPFRSAVVRRARQVGRPRGEALSEPFTSREIELLAYLPTRLTNSEIAARCYVSVNTVKTHVAHIYRKLDVQSRSAAVARAADLGLIGADGRRREEVRIAPGG